MEYKIGKSIRISKDCSAFHPSFIVDTVWQIEDVRSLPDGFVSQISVLMVWLSTDYASLLLVDPLGLEAESAH